MTSRRAETTGTANAKGATLRGGSPRVQRGRQPVLAAGDPEEVRPLARGEGMPVFVAGVFLALLALAVCYRHGWTLLYGDAVAHLGNARRIIDSHYPGLSQLGGAWLPLPHLLMLPFIENMAMWQTGLAAAPVSMISYAASVVGLWRLARRMMRVRWAVVATLFYALNPNLLYLATTAMSEALFLALFVWSVVAVVEAIAAIRAGNVGVTRPRLLLFGILVFLMVFTRYDGWVIGAVEWVCLAWQVLRAERVVRRGVMPWFVSCTALCAAGPLLWFWYNAHFDGDWLDFMRGPYSAKAIEAKTSKPGQHYPGWHNPIWSAVYFMRTAQIDTAAWETGWLVTVAALYGAWVSWVRTHPGNHLSDDKAVAKMGHPVSPNVGQPGRMLGGDFAILLWAPLPFYIYSVAYGSVPIFIPQLPPHAFYNARYGMELVPALCVYAALTAEWIGVWLRAHLSGDKAVAKMGHSDGAKVEHAGWKSLAVRYWQPAAMVLCVLNSVLMMAGFGSAGFLRSSAKRAAQDREAYQKGFLPAERRFAYPLVLQEAIANARTRVPFEHSLATVLEMIPVNAPVLMSTTAHVGAVQDAGRDLKSMISEADEQAWEAALADPAHKAAYVIALEGDAVAKAVAAHPEGLGEVEVVRTVGQPTARVYQSTLYNAGAPVYKPQATH